MSAAAQSARSVVPRRAPRLALAVPVDLSVLRSGMPASIPGRTLDLGEGGLCAILAGELRPGEEVGVEFRLPQVSMPIRAKAVVRHHDCLRCGVEFLGLSADQEAMIGFWERRIAVATSRSPDSAAAAGRNQPASPAAAPRRARRLRRMAWATAILLAALGALGWWRWHRAWEELESRLPGRAETAKPPATTVAPGIMERLLVHKVDPVYPEAARRTNLQGIVVLDAVIGRDGAVLQLRPISGPPGLIPAAMEAVKWWRFQPYSVNGQASEVQTTLAVEFRP